MTLAMMSHQARFEIVVTVLLVLILVNQLKSFRRIFMNEKQLIQMFKEATDEVATRVENAFNAFKAKIEAGDDLSPEDEQEANNIVAHLRGIGADPAAPIPELPPAVIETPEPEEKPADEAGGTGGTESQG